MYIINTTYAVPSAQCNEWKKWVSETLFPAVIRTELLTSPRMYKVMVASENGDESFCVQFSTGIEGVRLWKKELKATTQKLVSDTFGLSVIGFSTILKEVN